MKVEGVLGSHPEHLALCSQVCGDVRPQWPLFLGLPAEPLDPKRGQNLGQCLGLLCRRWRVTGDHCSRALTAVSHLSISVTEGVGPRCYWQEDLTS